jgi:hypothetical protein
MMPPTTRKTQLIGWLRKAPRRVRPQAVVNDGSTASALSSADTV